MCVNKILLFLFSASPACDLLLIYLIFFSNRFQIYFARFSAYVLQSDFFLFNIQLIWFVLFNSISSLIWLFYIFFFITCPRYTNIKCSHLFALFNFTLIIKKTVSNRFCTKVEMVRLVSRCHYLNTQRRKSDFFSTKLQIYIYASS